MLRILRGAGDEGLPTLEVAERMIEQTPGVTRLLDRLEIEGLIRRERCRADRRQHLCWLTSEGSRLLDRLDRRCWLHTRNRSEGSTAPIASSSSRCSQKSESLISGRQIRHHGSCT